MKNKMQISTVIFDVDGVLLDSVPIHFKAWKKTFEKEGISFSYDDYLEKVNGLPRLTGIQMMAPELTPEKQEALAEKKQSHFLEAVSSSNIPPLPGVEKFLQELTKNNFTLAAASSSKNAEHLLHSAHINTYFSTIITGNDFTHPKPHPDIFLTAAEKLKIFPTHCLVIEDATLGIKAAKAANMKAIGLLSSQDTQIASHADYTFPSLEHYPDILSLLLKN